MRYLYCMLNATTATAHHSRSSSRPRERPTFVPPPQHRRLPSGEYLYKIPIGYVARGVAQDRIEKHAACDSLSHVSYCDVMKYLCCSSCGSMRVSHSSRALQVYRSQDPITKSTRKPQQYSGDKLPHACGVASCSAGGWQACIAL